MCSCAPRLFRLGVLVVAICAFLAIQGVPLASAAPGNVLRDLTVPNSVGGVSVAFDGQYLYYTNLDGAVLHRVTPSGVAASDIPIVGAAGVNGLSYDAIEGVFWAVDASGRAVYRIRKDGVATLQFALVPAFDLPGQCDVPLGCNRIVSGLAYDSTGSLWLAPLGSERIYHYTTAGRLLGYFDTNGGTSALVPDCLTNGVSGIAAGRSSLFLSAGSCGKGFQYAKDDSDPSSKQGKFTVPGPSAGDLECDDATFSVNAVWVRSSNDGHLRAIEVPPGMCAFGGGTILDSSSKYMSGFGIANGLVVAEGPTVDVVHHFVLFCDPAQFSQSWFTASWTDLLGNEYTFELTHVVSADCAPTETPKGPCDPTQLPSSSCFNSITGEANGRLTRNNVLVTSPVPMGCGNECGNITFHFEDNGPPATSPTDSPLTHDTGEFDINDFSQGALLVHACGCKYADYRAHQIGQCTRS